MLFASSFVKTAAVAALVLLTSGAVRPADAKLRNLSLEKAADSSEKSKMRKSGKLKGNKFLDECKTYVFHRFLQGKPDEAENLETIIEAGPFEFMASCDEPKGRRGPFGTKVTLKMIITAPVDEDLIIFGTALKDDISPSPINNHTLPAGTSSTFKWFQEDHYGNGEDSNKKKKSSGYNGHGAAFAVNEKGKFSYFGASIDTMIGIHEDDYGLYNVINNVDCIVAGTVCVVVNEKAGELP